MASSAAGAAGAAAPPLLAKQAVHRLNAGVVRALRGSPLPGLAVVLVDKRAPVVYESYGVSKLGPPENLEATRPMTPDTVQPIGSSLAKNFTAVVLAQLHAEGKLRLDDPITTYVPNLRIAQAPGAAGEPITARHLLSHTSGIREFRHRQDLVDLVRHRLPFSNAPKGPMTLEQYYCGASGAGKDAQPPPIVAVGKPGGQHIKSHHNYGILALAAEKVTGQDIQTLIRQRVFTPLQMGDTDLVPPKGGHGERVGSSFKWSGKMGFKPIPQGGRFDASHGRPRAVGGSAYSTAVDVAKYLQALVDPDGAPARGVVTSAIMDELLRPVYQRDPFLPAQALSFAVEECTAESDPEVAYVTCGQGMGFGGYQTALCFSRQRGVGVAVLCNAGSDSYELSQVAAEAFHEATLRARAAAAVGSHHHHSSHQHHQHEGAGAAAAADPPAAAAPAPSPLKSLERAHALGKAFGMNADGFEAAVLWPQIVGVYQLPLDQLSARVLWTLGGEVQVYIDDSRLRMRALWGPLRTKLFYTKEKGQILMPARDGHPLHYSVAGNARQVLATPVNGFTDIAFDLKTKEMHIGLVSLQRAPWYRSLRLWLMGFIAYEALHLIGKGKAVDILSALFVIG